VNAAAATLPTTHALRALGAALVTESLVVFPVRHHSPGCAWHLRRLIEERRPSVILVEGPRGISPLIPLLTHAEARMPLAVYTYVVHKSKGDAAPARRASYFPFCDYSPELIALRAAQESGIPARFIDLDFAEQCHDPQEETDADASSLLDERHLERSAHLRLLARELGCRNHEELWEHLFECDVVARDPREHVANVAAYCQLARLDSLEDELRRDGTLAREAEMAWHIRAALDERGANTGPVLAVVGGFHAVVLPALVSQPVERPQISRSAISEENSTLIRYSFDRLDRLNGYASGMTSPAWHQRLWEQLARFDRIKAAGGPRARQESALAALFEIATLLRDKHRVALPMPALSAAFRQTLELAHLRGRSAPTRDDVLDSVTSCFIKGDVEAEGPVVFGAAHEVLTGVVTGKVPPGTPKPPLLRDFEYRARRQRLRIDDAEPRRAQLDIYRRAEHRVTSRLLHGLTLLGVPFALRTAGPDFVAGVGLDRLQEHWEYSFSAATEAALVEAAVHGVTVPLAVASRFRTELDRLAAGAEARDARAAARLLSQGCVLGLHDHLPRVLDLLRASIAQDPAFESVALATGAIGILWESREPLEARDVGELPLVLCAAYERAIFLGRNLRGAPTSDPARCNEIMHAMARLRELLVSKAGTGLDAALFWDMTRELASAHDEPLIRGASTGLLYSAGAIDAATLTSRLQGHFIGVDDPGKSVAFLRGLLHTARDAAWQQPELLSTLDQLLKGWEEPDFIAVLPELRLAFAAMTPKETDRIAEAVAALHGGRSLGPLVNYDVGEQQLAANLALSRTLLAVLEADGLGAWSGNP
jgi:hypothetical protein